MVLQAVASVLLLTVASWGLAVHGQVIPEGGKWRWHGCQQAVSGLTVCSQAIAMEVRETVQAALQVWWLELGFAAPGMCSKAALVVLVQVFFGLFGVA